DGIADAGGLPDVHAVERIGQQAALYLRSHDGGWDIRLEPVTRFERRGGNGVSGRSHFRRRLQSPAIAQRQGQGRSGSKVGLRGCQGERKERDQKPQDLNETILEGKTE